MFPGILCGCRCRWSECHTVGALVHYRQEGGHRTIGGGAERKRGWRVYAFRCRCVRVESSDGRSPLCGLGMEDSLSDRRSAQFVREPSHAQIDPRVESFREARWTHRRRQRSIHRRHRWERRRGRGSHKSDWQILGRKEWQRGCSQRRRRPVCGRRGPYLYRIRRPSRIVFHERKTTWRWACTVVGTVLVATFGSSQKRWFFECDF
mmetsp:Transcript_40395/g.84390  ORF Transcript_40395/g.84390 Transcript_40395/m.84390 type:complete len:206 (+) Transcript_40395:687-1304(+)